MDNPVVVVAEEKGLGTSELTEELTGESLPAKSKLGLGQAILDSAICLASSSQVPGIAEVATSIKILVGLHVDNKGNKYLTESSLRRCRTIITVLKRAEAVIGNRDDTVGEAGIHMMEDVHDSVSDMLELTKTYSGKNKISKLMTSTLFKKRYEELEACVGRAIEVFQFGLHIQVGNSIHGVKNDVSVIKEVCQGSSCESKAHEIAEARRSRRMRNLEKIEISSEDVCITDELLGRGGFGDVYLADYNGRNAAAKVFHIPENDRGIHKSFLLELETMIRLRSPYTVNVYGAITSLDDRFVLVMELISGGDLRNLLKRSSSIDPCKIVGDICAGMQFLHSRNTIHGDLKSANVLIDGNGQAKIADFGTSRWAHKTMSTGLVTMNTAWSKNTQMSLAWSAPEIVNLESSSTYSTDVYSFGMVVYEVLTRKLPWHNLARPSDITARVINGVRPTDIPGNSPEYLKSAMNMCWVQDSGDRPTFNYLLDYMKDNGWN